MEELILTLEGEKDFLSAVNRANQYTYACSAKDALEKQDVMDALMNHPDASILILMSARKKS